MNGDAAPARTARPASGSAPIGILCALPEELRLYREEVEHAISRPHGGMEVVRGILDGRPVVLVESGIGKVNAASAATVLVERYGCDRLLLSGVAGALDPVLEIGDVVVGTRVVQHDYGRVTDDDVRAYQPGAMPVPGAGDRVGWPLRADLLAHVRTALQGDPLPGIRAREGDAPHVPTVHFGAIATGDVFCASERLRRDLRRAGAHKTSPVAIAPKCTVGTCGACTRGPGCPGPWSAVRTSSARRSSARRPAHAVTAPGTGMAPGWYARTSSSVTRP